MGKKRTIQKQGGGVNQELRARSLGKAGKKKVSAGILFINSSYNNTNMTLADRQGNVLSWSSSGSLGFKGTKKGTPFAASKVGDLMSEKANLFGMQEVDVIIKGIGSGREASIRSFANKGISVSSIKDMTPVPHGGVRPKKPRRV